MDNVKLGDVYVHSTYGDFSIWVISGFTHINEYGDEYDVVYFRSGDRTFSVNTSCLEDRDYLFTNINVFDDEELLQNVVYYVSDTRSVKYNIGDKTIYAYENNRSVCSLGRLHKYSLCNNGHVQYGDDCSFCLNESIKPYSYKGYALNFQRDETIEDIDKNLYMGFEIEFEHNIRRDQKATQRLAMEIKKEFSDIIAECKHDGSLINGFECVSHPIHVGLIGGKWFNKRISALFEKIKNNNGTMADTCGLHFHLSNDGLGDLESTHCNLFLLLDVFQDLIKKISGRYELMSRKNLTNYCDYADDDYEDDDCYDEDSDLFHYCTFVNPLPINKRRQRKSYYMSKYNNLASHYRALNIENSKTSEIRFFGGTLNLNEFLFKANFIKSLVSICKMDNVDGVCFKDIINMLPSESCIYFNNNWNFTSDELNRKIIDFDFVEEEQLDMNLINKLNDKLKELDVFIDDTFRKHIYYRRDCCNMGFHLNDEIVVTMCDLDLFNKNKLDIDTLIDRLNRQKRILQDYVSYYGNKSRFQYCNLTNIIKNTLNELSDDVDNIISQLTNIFEDMDVIIQYG